MSFTTNNIETSATIDGSSKMSAPLVSASPSSSRTPLHSGQSTDRHPSTPLKTLAVYPQSRAINNRSPMAQSAKRRNSLQSLRSIAHLQHMYTRHGLASSEKPKILGRAHPALGLAATSPFALDESALPKTPVAPSQFAQDSQDSHARPPDLHKLKEDALVAWSESCKKWTLTGLTENEVTAAENDVGKKTVDLTDLISVTRATIRCVRDYLLAIPPDVTDSYIHAPVTTARPKASFRRQSSFYCSPRREVDYSTTSKSLPVVQSLAKQKSGSNLRGEGHTEEGSISRAQTTTLEATTTSIRNAAMDILVQLKQMEGESFELDRDEGAHLEFSLSDLGLASRDEVKSRAVTLRKIVPGSSLDKGRELVRVYLQLVSFAFEKIRNSENDTDNDGKLASTKIKVSPPWSQYDVSQGLSGALELLRAFVLFDVIFDGSNRRPVLEALSDGVILCQAFNGAVLASSKPWGLISLSDIDQADISRTFRKRHNLTVWTAALEARYGVSSASLDAILVAKGGPAEDWMDMLQNLICKWADAVAREINNSIQECYSICVM
jgi:hypothetical protein